MRLLLLSLLLCGMRMAAHDDAVVFKSNVALGRVDAQVLDNQGRAIEGLQISDFVLKVDGRALPIRSLASENMPVDVLLLLDVSGSMRPHIERIASASEQALNVLAPNDRVAIMVFDTSTRVRLGFRSDHAEVANGLDRVINHESFRGGTHITRALLDAAAYVEREARPNARRAIAILTDDETQDMEDEPRVESALARANAILSFLRAPYEEPRFPGAGRRRGTWGSGGGWPGGGIGFPGGGPISIGRRGPGGYGVDRSHSAGTATIARDSGGDTIPVDDASALEETLSKLRQRYALFFYLPEGATAEAERHIEVDLSTQARLRYEQAELRYRRAYLADKTSADAQPVITRTEQAPAAGTSETPAMVSTPAPRRRVAVNEDSGPQVNSVQIDSGNSSQQPPSAQTQPQQNRKTGGWPRANQENTPPQ